MLVARLRVGDHRPYGMRALNEVLQMHNILLSIHLEAASDGPRLRLTFKRRYQSCAHNHCQNASSKELGVAQYCHATGQAQVKLGSSKVRKCTQVEQITGFNNFRDGVVDFSPNLPVHIGQVVGPVGYAPTISGVRNTIMHEIFWVESVRTERFHLPT